MLPEMKPVYVPMVVCREVNVRTGEITVYPVETEVTDRVLMCLKLRARANPELRYFATTKGRWRLWRGEIEALLRQANVTRDMLEEYGGITEL